MTRWTLMRSPPPQPCGIAPEHAQHSLHQGTSIAYTSSRCASVGVQANPLIGTISCGQAEKATTQSNSARSNRQSPGLHTGGSKVRLPSACTGMFIKRFQGEGVSDACSPSAARAAARLSVQLSWYVVQPSKA